MKSEEGLAYLRGDKMGTIKKYRSYILVGTLVYGLVGFATTTLIGSSLKTILLVTFLGLLVGFLASLAWAYAEEDVE